MKLDRRQTAFKAEEITYLDRTSILLDRMLLSFFELLRFDGHPAVRRRRRQIDVPTLLDLINNTPSRFAGFSENTAVAGAWLANDLLEIANRGKVGREVVVGPRPFHLNAFKLAQSKYLRDYGASAQVWAMLYHADRPLLNRLKEFFGYGVDPASDEYDGHSHLDLETLAVLGMVDQVKVDHSPSGAAPPIEPLCTGQGRLLAEDLRCLLAYEDAVPRHVLATYVRTTLALHLSLLQLRLFRLVPALVNHAQHRESAPSCPVDNGETKDCSQCPYHFEIVVDLVEGTDGGMAQLAKSSAAEHIDSIAAYVRAVILLNRLKDFGAAEALRGRMPAPKTVADLLRILANPPERMDASFENEVTNTVVVDNEDEIDPIELAILRTSGLSPLDQYVEIICHRRLKNERNRLVTLVDSLTDKNRPGGYMKQTAGARSPRRFVLGSRLLETLVQIAVVDRDASGSISARPVLIDDFIDWMYRRYGFVIYAPAHRRVPIDDQAAWGQNGRALRERLHQIGFFTDLSDAYNSQTLRPRYEVKAYE